MKKKPRRQTGSRQAFPPESSSAAAEKLLQQALVAHQAGRFEEAEATYRRLHQQFPDWAEAVHLLGLVSRDQGRLEEAGSWIEQAVRLAPSSAKAHNDLGMVHMSTGRPEEAISSFLQALDRDPTHLLACLNLARAQTQIGLYQQAFQSFERCLALDPESAQVHFNRGLLLRQLGRSAEALAAFRRTAEIDPRHVPAYEQWIAELRSAGRHEDIETPLRAWLSVEPDNAIAAHLLAAETGTQTPDRASEGYVRQVFDKFAPTFDGELDQLGYQAPEIFATMLERLPLRKESALRVLDAGCGTGKCGNAMRPWASFLEGVDLSPAMLDRARRLDVYDQLVECDLVQFLQSRRNQYDLIISGDTFNYFGDLSSLLAGCREALTSEGLLLFSLEEGGEQSETYTLQSTGRYSHRESCAMQALDQAGFAHAHVYRDAIRVQAGEPVAGLFIFGFVKKPNRPNHVGPSLRD